MNPHCILTARLVLVPCDTQLIDLALQGDEALAQSLGMKVEPDWSEYGTAPLVFTRQQIEMHPEHYRWWTYLFVHRNENALIGMGGFKGAPDAAGMVEIGYNTAPARRLQGYATEAAAALMRHAFSFPEVKKVQAHTLAVKNESNHILEKIGMQFEAEIPDAELGSIWKWEMRR